MQLYCESLTEYKRLPTREVKVGSLALGNFHPIRVQTMTTTDTMDTLATVEQSIRCIEAGSELIRITAPSKREAENLLNIKNELSKRGYNTPIVADIHFTPNAAEIAARIVEKVRINPGNYIDRKKFEIIEYSDAEYQEEIDRIRERFTPLVKICKEYGTAMRIGTNHGSLSDRIMSRYGDTPIGMVESAMEFLRIARDENYHQVVLSMKSSNPQVMVHAYRLLVKTMHDEFGEYYPLHLGVTEAGDGEDGRIKSSIGTGTLLEDGLGDTIRVSLTEDPELEIAVCKNLVKRYESRELTVNRRQPAPQDHDLSLGNQTRLPYDPFNYQRRETFAVDNVGGKHVPVVIADLSKIENIMREDLNSVGYTYDADLDKWNISDAAADYIFTANQEPGFALPGTLKVIMYYRAWLNTPDKEKYFPILEAHQYKEKNWIGSSRINFIMLDCFSEGFSVPSLDPLFAKIKNDPTAVLCLSSTNRNAMQSIRRMFVELENNKVKNPAIVICDNKDGSMDESLIHYSVETGALLLDGFCDGICLGHHFLNKNSRTDYRLMNSVAFGILQAARTRISKTEYISCPSCGRTLFDLQETTARIRAVTNHLKGVKIAIMGCIVNGPGEMADADFGYVGSGPGKITLYKGKEIVKRNVNSEVAVDELVDLLKENEAWVEPTIEDLNKKYPEGQLKVTE
ncbi:MAG TPA: (E)-4-hydroxy-3-methylbut-2-enyl-diphosphate synthase [Chitinophagaceae bacterium]|nr:(E)-4-hydroxy-3-methylbut-2-enyl-diphosphate synthase [Chitinophagaceae bacterium]